VLLGCKGELFERGGRMHIKFRYWGHKKGSASIGSIHFITLSEDELCELAKSEVGEHSMDDFEYKDFTVEQVVCD